MGHIPIFQSRLAKYFLILVLTVGAIALTPTKAWSQFSFLPDSGQQGQWLPTHVSRYGGIEVAWVRSPIDNAELFEVTSATVFDRTALSENDFPVEVRAEAIEARLERTVERLRTSQRDAKGSERDQVSVVSSVLNNQFILQLQDTQNSRPLQLTTVTDIDAEYYGETPEILTERWQGILQQEVERIAHLTSPKVIRGRMFRAGQILMGMAIAHILIYILRKLSLTRQHHLETLHQQEQAHQEQERQQESENEMLSSPSASEALTLDKTSEDETEKAIEDITENVKDIVDQKAKQVAHMERRRRQILRRLQQQFGIEQRLRFHRLFQWFCFWVLLVIWYVGAYQVITTMPALMKFKDWILTTPLTLLITWFIIGAIIRILKDIINRFNDVWKNHPHLTPGESQRKILRTSTITQALKGLVQTLCVTVGLFITLSLLNVPTESLLAGGAVIGLALSFGTQNLIKDLVNGCLILIEDQYAIGDVIVLDNLGADGFVENLNLFVTQLRNGEGQLITIHNSSINQVKNLTRLWSRVDFTIRIAYDSDPHKALKILNEVAQAMYQEPEWQAKMPNPPEVLGIDGLAHDGILIRVWLQTMPLQQWSVGREYRLRVWTAFNEQRISIGTPQTINHLQTVEPGNGLVKNHSADTINA